MAVTFTYMICSEPDAMTLMGTVQRYLNRGFELHGDLQIKTENTPNGEITLWIQPVVRRDYFETGNPDL